MKTENTLKIISIAACLLFSSCGSQEWRYGNPYGDRKIMDKRQDQRDKYTKRANKIRYKTAKHYVKEWKSHDGKINIFRKDGFD